MVQTNKLNNIQTGTLKTERCTLHNAHCILYTASHCPMHSSHCALYSVNCTVVNAVFTLNTRNQVFKNLWKRIYKVILKRGWCKTFYFVTFNCISSVLEQVIWMTCGQSRVLYTVHCTLYTIHSTLCTLRCTQYTVHCTLFTVHCTLFTVHCSLYTVYYTLCTTIVLL